MDERGIARMLLFAATMDYRVSNAVEVVKAWSLVLDGDMETEWAAEFVRAHYANSTDALLAANVNAAWRRHRARARELEIRDTPGHCGRASCYCTHEDCINGWIEGEDGRPLHRCAGCKQSLPGTGQGGGLSLLSANTPVGGTFGEDGRKHEDRQTHG